MVHRSLRRYSGRPTRARRWCAGRFAAIRGDPPGRADGVPVASPLHGETRLTDFGVSYFVVSYSCRRQYAFLLSRIDICMDTVTVVCPAPGRLAVGVGPEAKALVLLQSLLRGLLLELSWRISTSMSDCQ